MKREILYDAITGIREDLICRAEACHAKKRTFRWQGAVAAVLAAAVIGGAMLRSEGNPMVPSAYAIAQAQYPEMAPYPMESDYATPTGGFDDEGFPLPMTPGGRISSPSAARRDTPTVWKPFLPPAAGNSSPVTPPPTGSIRR